jgi:hypothetical protein
MKQSSDSAPASARGRSLLRRSLLAIVALGLGAGASLFGTCGPFTDVAADAFCPFVLEIFTLGITTGTSATTYDPASAVSRLQMAAFLSRSVDAVLSRGSRRAALGQFWTPQNDSVIGLTTVGPNPIFAVSDGADVWTSNGGDATVSRVRASDGRLLATWTGATLPFGVISAMGSIFVTGRTVGGGSLYRIDPAQPAGAVNTIFNGDLGENPSGITFDGSRLWTANFVVGDKPGTMSVITPGTPFTATTVTAGFTAPLFGALFDGSNVWVTEYKNPFGNLLKLDASGAIAQTVALPGGNPQIPGFDGANIFVPGLAGNFVAVVRASNGTILATLTGNGLSGPNAAAFDGQRILVTNGTGNSVSLWKAADLSPLGSVPVGSNPFGACSDGVNFWIALNGVNLVARY